jgi:hypothetical protein
VAFVFLTARSIRVLYFLYHVPGFLVFELTVVMLDVESLLAPSTRYPKTRKASKSLKLHELLIHAVDPRQQDLCNNLQKPVESSRKSDHRQREGVPPMPITNITIPLDTDTARVYSAASPEDQRKLRLLLTLWFREFAVSRTPLRVIMDEISKKAQSRGLTPEILESLLNAD